METVEPRAAALLELCVYKLGLASCGSVFTNPPSLHAHSYADQGNMICERSRGNVV